MTANAEFNSAPLTTTQLPATAVAPTWAEIWTLRLAVAGLLCTNLGSFWHFSFYGRQEAADKHSEAAIKRVEADNKSLPTLEMSCEAKSTRAKVNGNPMLMLEVWTKNIGVIPVDLSLVEYKVLARSEGKRAPDPAVKNAGLVVSGVDPDSDAWDTVVRSGSFKPKDGFLPMNKEGNDTIPVDLPSNLSGELLKVEVFAYPKVKGAWPTKRWIGFIYDNKPVVKGRTKSSTRCCAPPRSVADLPRSQSGISLSCPTICTAPPATLQELPKPIWSSSEAAVE